MEKTICLVTIKLERGPVQSSQGEVEGYQGFGKALHALQLTGADNQYYRLMHEMHVMLAGRELQYHLTQVEIEHLISHGFKITTVSHGKSVNEP